MTRRLEGSVVIVVGASSGVGRATAEALGRHRCRLVLAARDEDALDEAAAACRQSGSEAVVVRCDLTRPEEVAHLAEVAVATYGRIDTWVNVASILVAGRIEDTPLGEVDQVVATNIRGTALASAEALQRFRRQGHGVLINVSSILGVVVNPWVPVYVMSKAAVRGLTLSLHHAVADAPDIAVCVVLPGPIDTPMFTRAANHTGRALRSVPPAISPQRVAAGIVSCVRRPRRQVVVGATGHLIMLGVRVLPAFAEWAVARYSGRFLLGSPAAPTAGGTFDPSGPHQVDGGFRRGAARRAAGDALGRWQARGLRR